MEGTYDRVTYSPYELFIKNSFKGGDWVLFVPTSDVLYAWNSAENSLNQVALEKGKHSHIHFKLLAFNGAETILYVTSLDYLAAEEDDRFERYVRDIISIT